MLRDLEFWSETVLEFGTIGNCNEAYKTCAKCAVKYFLKLSELQNSQAQRAR